MKKIVAPNGEFGPFNSVADNGDHFLADGTVYPLHIIGGSATVEDVQDGDFPDIEGLARAKAARREHLEAAYAATTQAGFVSSALGAPHTYPSTMEAQLDLVGTVVRGKPSPFACVDGNGVKAPKNHTYPQIQQVLEDGAAHKLALYTNLQTKLAAVEAATTVEGVLAVAW